MAGTPLSSLSLVEKKRRNNSTALDKGGAVLFFIVDDRLRPRHLMLQSARHCTSPAPARQTNHVELIN